MTFDIKKFLKDTKAGPYGMIQEGGLKKKSFFGNDTEDSEEQSHYLDIPTGPDNGWDDEKPMIKKKKPAFVIPAADAYDIQEEAQHFQYLLDKAGVKAKAIANMVGEEVEIYTKDEQKARRVIEKSGYTIGWNDELEEYSNSLTEDETYLGPKKPEANKIYNSPQGDEEYAEDNAWMQDIDAEQVGEFIVTCEHPGIITWNKQGTEEDMFFAATPKWDGQPGTPIEAIFAEGDPDTEMIYVEKQDEFVSFQEYAETIYPILKKFLESKRKDIHGEMFEEEGDLKEYSWDDEGTDDPDREEMQSINGIKPSEENRIMDLGGNHIQRGIQNLVDDGFQKSDILNLVRSILSSSHDAASRYS
jgi:hypothetical protein